MRAAKGEGSAFKSKAGGYRGYVTVDGKRKYFTAKSKAEAAQKKRDLLNRRDDGALVAGKVPTVAQWMNHWLENVAKQRPTTYAMNRWVIDKKINPKLGDLKLTALTPERIEKWVADLGVVASSSRRYLAPLKTALGEAARRGHVGFNAAERVELSAPAKPKTASFSRADRDAILAVAKRPEDARWHLALKFGLRPGEALGLTWEDFDDVAGTLSVHAQLLYAKGTGVYLQEGTKTSAGSRTLHLPKSLVLLLKEHRAAQAEWMNADSEWVGWEFGGKSIALIFTQQNGRPITSKIDQRHWTELLDGAGLEYANRYQTRHTAATHLILETGGDVAVTAHILGHADAGFTYRTYVHPLEAQAKKLAKQMDAPYGAPYDAEVQPPPAKPAAKKSSKKQG